MKKYSIVKIAHKIPIEGYVIVKIGDKYFKIKEI